MSGLLIGSHNWYPVINGIPRLLTGELKNTLLQSHHSFFKRWKKSLPKNIATEWQKTIKAVEDFDRFVKHQDSTARSFAYEWEKIYKENDYEQNNFLHFISPFVKQRDLKNKEVIDIGCGSGRFTKQAALLGAKVAFGTDLGESVGVAFKLTKDLENICIVQADIYHMPFKNRFDLGYSIGVLHHLPQPEDGFRQLRSIIKPKGRLLIWVYSRRNNARALYFYEPLRSVLKNIPKPVLFRLCYVPALVVHGFNGLTHLFNLLGAKNIAKKIPFYYYANFPFNMKLNDAFDVLATPKSNYYYKEDIEAWYARAILKNVAAFEHPEAGITCIGTYAG